MANLTGKGWFKKGNKVAAGRGNVRVRWIEITRSCVTEDEWRGIVARAKRDALGVRIALVKNQNGLDEQKLIDDPKSDGTTRNNARTFLASWLMGKPPQPIEMTDEESSESVLAKYTDAQLDAIILAAESMAHQSGESFTEQMPQPNREHHAKIG